jgi:hypothetical protein
VCILCAIPARQRGGRVVTDVEAGGDGRGGARDEARSKRTAKTCGPDPPMLGSSVWTISRATVAKKPGRRGERAISRKAIAQGMPDRFGCPVVACVRKCTFFARKAHGCGQHPVFPAPSELRRDPTLHHSDAKRAAGMLSHIPSAVMLRESGASSAPRPIGSSTAVSGILGRPVPSTPRLRRGHELKGAPEL